MTPSGSPVRFVSGPFALIPPSNLRGLALGEATLPGEGLLDDGREVVVARRPAKPLADAVGPGDERGRVARPPWRDADREVDPGHALHHLDHLEHREAATIAAIEHQALATPAQMTERRQM